MKRYGVKFSKPLNRLQKCNDKRGYRNDNLFVIVKDFDSDIFRCQKLSESGGEGVMRADIRNGGPGEILRRGITKDLITGHFPTDMRENMVTMQLPHKLSGAETERGGCLQSSLGIQ